MFGPGGSFFVWVGGMNGGRDERTDRQSTSGVGHRRCVGCGWGELFAICREGIGG